MEPTRNALSIELEQRLHDEVLTDLKIREDWCRTHNFVALVLDSSGDLKELQGNFLAAVSSQKSEMLVAVLLEDLNANNLSSSAFSPTLEYLEWHDRIYGPFESALTDSRISFVLLLTKDDYLAVAGPKSFVEILCGTTIAQARAEFKALVSDTSEVEKSIANLRSQGKEAWAAGMEARFKRDVKRLLDIAAYYEQISCE